MRSLVGVAIPLSLLLTACFGRTPPECGGACADFGGGGVDFGYPPGDFGSLLNDSGFPPPYDLVGYPPYDFGIGFPPYDFGGIFPYDLSTPIDFGHHPHHDFGGPPPPQFDLSQPVSDLAYTPDLGGGVTVCEQCLDGSCSSQVSTCKADTHCTAALGCVVQSGCFTYASGSSTFANCVDYCVTSENLTLQQTVAVLNEIGGLASCAGNCVDSCGGN